MSPGRSRCRITPFPQWVDTSTLFVGREDDAASLIAAVAASRLVTVTGPGGVGKTRLVAESLPRLAAVDRPTGRRG